MPMRIEEQLRERLRKVEALYFGATSAFSRTSEQGLEKFRARPSSATALPFAPGQVGCRFDSASLLANLPQIAGTRAALQRPQ
jgi:hypothetical protein